MRHIHRMKKGAKRVEAVHSTSHGPVLSTGMTRLLEPIEVHPVLNFSLFFHDGRCQSLVVSRFSCQLSCQLRT